MYVCMYVSNKDTARFKTEFLQNKADAQLTLQGSALSYRDGISEGRKRATAVFYISYRF